MDTDYVDECKMLNNIGADIIWFDSLGAKSASIAIKSDKGFIVIDPGAAEMQPSYPLPAEAKLRLRKRAVEVISNYMIKACTVVITHYHYDHHILPSDKDVIEARKFWLNAKTLILKNPNKYINKSQWERARLFLSEILSLLNTSLSNYLEPPKQVEFEDVVEGLKLAIAKRFGDYQERREYLLEKGKRWFHKLAKELWGSKPWVREIVTNEISIIWGDDKEFEIGEVRLKILKPWFHGVEYDRTGWVIPILVKKNNYTLLYSSDVMGPIIEDYADYISKQKPDVVILDGPPTYLYPYMLNSINLRRAIENVITVLSARPTLVIYDHHLLREAKWRDRTREVFVEAKKLGVTIVTAAECLGTRPLIDMLTY